MEITRLEFAARNKNELAKYKKEANMCLVFAKNGYKMEHLNEVPGISSPDVRINGVFADLKHTSGFGNIVKYAKDAITNQGANIVLFEFEKRVEDVYKELDKLKKTGIKVKYFFSDEKDKIHLL